MKDSEKAKLFIEQVKERLTALVDNRPFVFRDTAIEDAEAYLNSKKAFEGLDEEQVSLLEFELGVEFPTLFRTFLRELGLSCGLVFTGSDCNPKDYSSFLEVAADLVAQSGLELFLTDKSVVFLVHQGYTFLYFESAAGYDTAILQYTEGEDGPQQIASTFAELVDSELHLAEDLNRSQRERGGYYLTVGAAGCRESHPALASGERPLDIGDVFLKKA
jgi:hypothetical protein